MTSSNTKMNTLFNSILLLGGAVDAIKTIQKDVVIIGAGSSGVYTGIRLMDEGRDVVLIERSDDIGSHANTYYDPATGAPINLGVQGFHNTSFVRDYFARLNVSTVSVNATGSPVSTPTSETVNVDFSTGEELTNYTSPSSADVFAAFQTFRDFAEQYAYLDDGWNLPDPIPEELFLPLSTNAQNYGFVAALPFMAIFLEPVEFWNEPTLYVLKNFGLESAEAVLNLLQVGSFKPADVNEIYFSAAEILGSRVLLNSTATSVTRSSTGVSVEVNTPDGLVRIEASKIVMAAPPFLENFAGWDLSPEDSDLFSKFMGRNNHIGVTRNPEWNNVSFQGVGPEDTFGTPRLPGLVSMFPTGFSDSSYYHYVVFQENVAVEDAQALFKEQVATMVANGVLPESTNEIVAWYNHNNYMNRVPEADIRAGFYNKLNALQGQSNTFYVGAVWAGQDSSMIWRVIDAMMPKLLE